MKFWSLAAVLGLAYCVCHGASARDLSAEALAVASTKRMAPFGRAEAPIGYEEFCRMYPIECLPEGPMLERVTPTREKWDYLVFLNRQVNYSIKPVSDLAQYGVVEHWTYPDLGKGDCEDYVLIKRRRLMEAGWPQSALLITVVRDEHNEGHAILTVRTTKGDYVLDNKHSKILAWERTRYTFIKRQSGKDPRQWVSLVPLDSGPTVASAGVDWKD